MAKRTIRTKIVGPGLFGDRTRQRYRDLRKNQVLSLSRDLTNEHDSAATMVMIVDRGRTRPVGYLPSAAARIVAPILDAGGSFSVTVTSPAAAGANPQVKLTRRRRN